MNALTRAMDMVQQYNQTYTPRAFGGQGVPATEFAPQPQQEAPVQPMQPIIPPQAPPVSQDEAQRRLLAWAAESGQVLDPQTGNVAGRVPVMQAPYGANPGVVRRYNEVPQPQPQYGPQPQQYYQPVMQPAQMPRMSLTPMSIQSIQSIDFDRSVVWADGTPFPFDPKEAQPVLQFALEVILRQFAVQFGSLLQRYGFVQGSEGVRSMPSNAAGSPVPQGQQQARGTQELLQDVPRGDAAGVPQPGTVPVEVPVADATGTADGSGGGQAAT